MIDQTNSRLGFSSCLYVVVVGFWLVSGMMTAMANSDRLDASLKAALQATMIRFIDNASDDEGGFCYIERQSGALMTAYPGVIHPKIIPVGDDYFLCIDRTKSSCNSNEPNWWNRSNSIKKTLEQIKQAARMLLIKNSLKLKSFMRG